jgi:hypothetical protein
MNKEEFGRKRSFPVFNILSQHLPAFIYSCFIYEICKDMEGETTGKTKTFMGGQY